MKEIIVLHEYGAINHYKGLSHLAEENDISIRFMEFSCIFQFIKGVYKKDPKLIRRSIENLISLICLTLNLNKKQKIIIGIAPFDWRVIIINLITYRNQCFLHTSWPFWDGSFQPKRASKLSIFFWLCFVNKLKGVFAVTDSVKNGFLNRYPHYPEDKVSIVNHSIDDDFYQASLDNKNPKNEKLSVIFVGRLDLSKGVDILLDSAYKYPLIDFHLVGEGSYELGSHPRNLILHGKITSRIELAILMSQSDLLLLPSRKQYDWQELFGMVIIEALSTGLYPIVTNHIGPREIISKSCGCLIDEAHMKSEVFDELNRQSNLFKQNKMLAKTSIKQYSKLYTTTMISKKWRMILE